MSDAHAAGFVVTYQSSYFALVHRARLAAGEWLMVHGGAGGIGTAAIQIGKALGARVIATAGSAGKREVCLRAGADHVLDESDPELAAGVDALTGGHGSDVICDPVGGDVFDRSTRCLAWSGRLVVVGFASGRIPTVAANRILLKNVSVIGLHWGTYFEKQPELIELAHQHLCRMYEAGRIEPIIGRSFPFERLPDGLTAIEHRQSFGKVIVRTREET
jgi:NADPH2:quinone reductase